MQIARGSARTPRQLSESLLRHLDLYAVAASAAGVSLLALTQSAEGKIVYTKTHQVIGYNGIYDLDLNHDGTVDFVVQQLDYCNSTSCQGFQRSLRAKGALGNGVAGNTGGYSRHYASVLKAGAAIGPHQHFISGPNSEVMVAVAKDQDFSTIVTWGGWINVKNRYLGLKFKIKGKTHYGWARLDVQTSGGNITGTLTGYAYETVANRSIRAGQTKGGETIEPSNQNAAIPLTAGSRNATLGELALGAQEARSRRQP